MKQRGCVHFQAHTTWLLSRSRRSLGMAPNWKPLTRKLIVLHQTARIPRANLIRVRRKGMNVTVMN